MLLSEKIKSEINNLKNESLLTSKIANYQTNNPERPVVSSVSCHASRISEFVDNYLKPEVKKLKSYVKGTMDFIKKIEAIDHYLVSLDVRSLYTSIPHKEGIEAVKQKLKKSKPSISIRVILIFLKLILSLNNFVFNGINYLHKKGSTMGTKCATSYSTSDKLMQFLSAFYRRYLCNLEWY